MADTAVTERRIRPIQDAVDAGNWRQALKECEKWQKKGEASDRFLALKAAVLLNQPDYKNQEKGRNETLQLCRRPTPISNIDAIHQLQDSLALLNLESEEAPQLWERAVAAKPTDKDLVSTWLNNSIAASNWQSAQKATMALKKAYPRDRQYDFWNILMCYLIHEDNALPEKDRKLFGTLANRMVTKAAQPGQSEKMMVNSEELSLLATIILKTGTPAELVSLLKGDALRNVVDQDRAHTDTLLLQAIESAPDVTEHENAVFDMITPAPMPDNMTEDDRKWSLYVRAAAKSQRRQACVELLDVLLLKHPQHRQALLARIDLLVSGDEDDCSAKVLEACQAYHSVFGSKAFCFDDLIQRLRAVGVQAVRDFQARLLEDTTSNAAPIQKLFNLKLEYFLMAQEPAEEETSFAFAAKALELYGMHQADVAAAEAALMASLAILRMCSTTNDSGLMLQANAILQSACLHFKDYYPLRILLIQVQAFSGQLHLAMQNFLHLSVKNLQWETIGHLLLTRISTLHPQQHGRGEDVLSPLGALDTALNVFSNSQRSMNRAIRDGLDMGSYSNVVDTIELRKNLQRSIVRQLYAIEQRKCLRSMHLPLTPRPDQFEGELTDLRDMSFMPTYGVKEDISSHFLEVGPRPSRSWLDAMNLHECLTMYFLAEQSLMQQNAPDAVWEIALEHLARAEVKASADAADLSTDEQEAMKLYLKLSGITLQLAKRKDGRPDDLNELVKGVQTPDESKSPCINGVAYPDAKWLHHRFVRLEMLQTLGYFTAVLRNKLKIAKGKLDLPADFKQSIEGLSAAVGKQVEAIHAAARELKNGLNASGVLGKLVDAVLGRAEGSSETCSVFSEKMTALQDEAAVEEYCGSMKESWEDALDGVLTVKIKTL